jgi:hypothetical protein
MRKLGAMIYNSNSYGYISKKIDKIRDDKLLEQIKENPVPEHVAIITI